MSEDARRMRPALQYSLPIPGRFAPEGRVIPPIEMVEFLPVTEQDLPAIMPLTVLNGWIGGLGRWRSGISMEWTDGTRALLHGPEGKTAYRPGSWVDFDSPFQSVTEFNYLEVEIRQLGAVYVHVWLDGEQALRYPIWVGVNLPEQYRPPPTPGQ